ncbi:MAG TPA: AAA family ATPase, partial [Acidimicrobiales bacterium]|nr:AAA family ATPase [Acidimicrobiales bacterium]
MATSQPITHEATFADYFDRVVDNIERVIQGKREVIELILLCLISEGHLLLEDVPGVGKTSPAKSLATSLDASFGRVQFTPDLLPSDVVGLTVWNRSDGTFTFRPGPIFNNVVLADEINRASPKTQAALLEAMAEDQVTVDGATYPMSHPFMVIATQNPIEHEGTYPLEAPFMVIATQNPIEHEGTYPLPESQLDRFLMRLSVGYPARASE